MSTAPFTYSALEREIANAPMKAVSNISEPAKPKLITEINR